MSFHFLLFFSFSFALKFIYELRGVHFFIKMYFIEVSG